MNNETESLKEKTAKGLFWGGMNNGVQQLIGLVFGIILGRLLSPDVEMFVMPKWSARIAGITEKPAP